MTCQYCGSVRSKVIDSRQNEDGTKFVVEENAKIVEKDSQLMR